MATNWIGNFSEKVAFVTGAASGIGRREDVQAAAAAGADAVLVGETLMRAPFPEDVLGELTGVPRGASER